HTRLQGDWSSDVCSSDLTELPVAGGRDGIQPRHGFGEERLVRGEGRTSVGTDVVGELRIDVRGILGAELRPLVLDAPLDGVIARQPLQMAEGDLLFDGRPLLAFVLGGQRARRAGGDYRLIIAVAEAGGLPGIHGAVSKRVRRG